jgi:hypothetical protein
MSSGVHADVGSTAASAVASALSRAWQTNHQKSHDHALDGANLGASVANQGAHLPPRREFEVVVRLDAQKCVHTLSDPEVRQHVRRLTSMQVCLQAAETSSAPTCNCSTIDYIMCTAGSSQGGTRDCRRSVSPCFDFGLKRRSTEDVTFSVPACCCTGLQAVRWAVSGVSSYGGRICWWHVASNIHARWSFGHTRTQRKALAAPGIPTGVVHQHAAGLSVQLHEG